MTHLHITATQTAAWQENTNHRGETWRAIDLSGVHLGARIEAIAPGAASSEHHYHTQEEEHVYVLKGRGWLLFGDSEQVLSEGDHVWFAAGVKIAHHIENRTDEELQLFVFGERKAGDAVFYPESQHVLMKSDQSVELYSYRPQSLPGESS